MSGAVDLWGEPVLQQPPLPTIPPTIPGPHHLRIPLGAPAFLQEKWCAIADLGVRDRHIQWWLDEENRRRKAREREHNRWKRGNPMLAQFGAGPEEKRCKSCRRFHIKRYASTYFKCDLRGDTNGPGTDHRANWPACGRYEPKPESVGVA